MSIIKIVNNEAVVVDEELETGATVEPAQKAKRAEASPLETAEVPSE